MVTVANFTSDLEQIRCVAGFRGTNRKITSFSIIDTPEILDWLHGGEFVVDSGYITFHNPSILKGFVASLKEKGCAALGVKLHRYHNEIPNIILEDGNKLDFPIYELPYNLYFCDFAYTIHKRMFEEQLDEMYHVSIAYKDIVDSLSKYKVPERMLSELSLVLKNPVFLTNSRFELIDYSYGPNDNFSSHTPPPPTQKSPSPKSNPQESWTGLDENMRQKLLKKYQQQPYQFHHFSIDGSNGETNCTMLYSGNIDGDAAFLVIPEINKLEDWHYKVIKDISALFQLTACNKINTQDFAASVIMAQSNSTDTILRYCKMYNFDYAKQRICLAVELNNSMSISSTRRYIIRDIFASITSWITNTYGCKVFFLKTHTHYVLYLLFSNDVSQETAEYQAAESAKKIHQFFGRDNISTLIGISLYASDPQQISKAFFQAIDAINLGQKLYPAEYVFLFRTIQVYQWLSTMPQENLMEMYMETVEPLCRASNADVNYVQVLRTYIENHYNISKTASDLHIHRNTMMNYMARIQELLPYNIGQPENRLKLQIGIHAMYLLDKQNES